MLITRVHTFLTNPLEKTPPSRVRFWLILSLAVAVSYGIMGLSLAFEAPYVVQDDARQHVFWMQRFVDPTLFPNDLIADYFQSVAPVGYAGLYRIMAFFGINPMLLNKLLPIILELIVTVFTFGICLELLPIPFAGFLGSALMNQHLWLHDDLSSGTARAFLFPFFTAFLYFVLKRSLIPCLITIVLQGIFYPQFVLVMTGILFLRVFRWEGGLKLSGDRKDYWFTGLGLAVAIAVLLPYVLESSPYGPNITLEQAKNSLEFSERGRTRFFVSDPIKYWLTEKRTGAILWVMPLSILSVFLFPIELSQPDRFPLVRQLRHRGFLAKWLLVALAIFLAAHALLFTLYLPGRYMQNTVVILTAITGGLSVTIALDALLRWAGQQVSPRQSRRRRTIAIGTLVFTALLLVLSTELYQFPKDAYVRGDYPAVYSFFSRQPKDILIASLARETDNIPSFSQRSILAGREYSLPYHTGYYSQMKERIEDLIEAQYTPDPTILKRFIRKYGIDYWVIDKPYLRQTYVGDRKRNFTNIWIQQYQPLASEVSKRLDAGIAPIMPKLLEPCSVVEDQNLIVLDAQCMLETPLRRARAEGN